MRKLTLDLSALAVQSFATDDFAARLFGTVHGRHKGHTGQQDTDCSAVDACPSALVECPRTRGNDCQSNDPCSDFVACSEIGCSEQGCHETRGCSHGHHCASDKEPCISERECTRVDCPAEA